ncbi:unnamed protein product [Victoria cruziana]
MTFHERIRKSPRNNTWHTCLDICSRRFGDSIIKGLQVSTAVCSCFCRSPCDWKKKIKVVCACVKVVKVVYMARRPMGIGEGKTSRRQEEGKHVRKTDKTWESQGRSKKFTAVLCSSYGMK